MEKPYVMQLTMKNGIHVMIGVTSFEEYKKLRQKITSGVVKWVDVIDSCTVKKDEVVLIEFFEAQKGEEKK